MRKEMITAVENGNAKSDTDTVAVYIFTVLDDSISLIEAVKKAVTAYINTESGYRKFKHNCHSFNWGGLDVIPNSFLRQFGFEKEDCKVSQTVVDLDERLATDDDLKFSDEKWAFLKKELFMNGTEALEDFIGTSLGVNLEKDSIEKLLDEISDQMPNEELFEFYLKYCSILPSEQVAKEQRIQKLVKDMDDAQVYISSSDELEMDYFDDIEINGEHKSGWFACRYYGSCSTILAEFSDHPLITDEEIVKYGINIRKVFDDHGIAYCG